MSNCNQAEQGGERRGVQTKDKLGWEGQGRPLTETALKSVTMRRQFVVAIAAAEADGSQIDVK